MTDEEILQAKALADEVLAVNYDDVRVQQLAYTVHKLTGALADEKNAHSETISNWVTL
jgi:hypothetical protein